MGGGPPCGNNIRLILTLRYGYARREWSLNDLSSCDVESKTDMVLSRLPLRIIIKNDITVCYNRNGLFATIVPQKR